jgi:probable rRNA maturation factor
MNPVIEVAIEAKDWASLEAPSKRVQTAILAAVEGSGLVPAANAEISVVLCGDALIRELNREWRGYDAPTNVLFCRGRSGFAPLLGDIVIAFETASRKPSKQETARSRRTSFGMDFCILSATTMSRRPKPR